MSDAPLYTIAVMPTGDVALYPGYSMTQEDVSEAFDAMAAVGECLRLRKDTA